MTTFFQALIDLLIPPAGRVEGNRANFSTFSQPATQPMKHHPAKTAGQNRGCRSSRSLGSNRADMVGLVGFHDRGFVVAKPAEPHAHWLQERVTSLPDRVSGASTNITDGLRKAIGLLEKSPRERLRRIWLLTDGMPNREQGELMTAVAEARRQYININTIGFGDPGAYLYDPDLLRRIAGATHNGRFVPVDSLRTLSNALKGSAGQGLGNRRPETTVLAIDCSGSMLQYMENKRRIDVVVEAITHLLHYKQKCFA